MTGANVIRFGSYLPLRHSRHHRERASAGGSVIVEPTQSRKVNRRIYDPGLDPSLGEQGVQDESARVLLCRLQSADVAETADLLGKSADFHKGWVAYPTDPDDIAAFIEHSPDNGVLIFGIRRRSDKVLVGITTLSRIAYEPWLTAECGAAVDVRYRGNGYVAEGMRLLISFAIEHLEFHRIEALVRRENIRSVRMLESARFRREGTARGAVRIEGAWVDHIRWAITAEDLTAIRQENTIAKRL
jgi:[ribosomal protein S5]-alanine N-acetyltransferase